MVTISNINILMASCAFATVKAVQFDWLSRSNVSSAGDKNISRPSAIDKKLQQELAVIMNEEALIKAIMSDDATACKHVLKLGADPTKVMSKQSYDRGFYSGLEYSREYCARTPYLNAQNPMFVALFYNKIKAFKALLEWRYLTADDVNFLDANGDTLIFFALRTALKHNLDDAPELISLLVEKGAEVTLENKNKDSPMSLAMSNISSACSRNDNACANSLDVMRVMFLTGARRKRSSHGGETELFHAIRHSTTDQPSIDALNALISMKEVDVNAQNMDGETPIFAAVRYEKPVAFRALIANGADLEHLRSIRSELKKNLANKIFGFEARCDFWLKLGW